MELSHTFTVPATVDQTWAIFMDLPLVGGCFPGATVTSVAIAAFTFGTETIPQVDKICGPGNTFVAAAKRRV